MSRIGRFAASPEEREKGANVSTGKVLKNGVIDACGERDNPIHNMIVGVVLGARLKWLGFWLSPGMTRYTHNMHNRAVWCPYVSVGFLRHNDIQYQGQKY